MVKAACIRAGRAGRPCDKAWRMRLPPFLRRRRDPPDWARMAQEAQARGDWTAAVAAYRRITAAGPDDAAAWVQFAHVLKEAGQRRDAAAAYRHAASLVPTDIDVRVHWAAMLRDDGATADAAAVFAQILEIEPTHVPAARALAELCEREQLPRRALSRAVHGARFDAAGTLALAAERQNRDWLTTGAFPVTAYDLFRRRYPVPPPPASGGSEGEVNEALVLAVSGSAAMLHATLMALADQTVPLARITVAAPAWLRAHPVASPGFAGAVHFVEAETVWQSGVGKSVLLLQSGTIPDPQALAWLAFARRRTGSALAYADHDACTDDWRGGPFHAEPVLFGAHDPLFLRETPQPPAVVLADAKLLAGRSCAVPPAQWLRSLTVETEASVHVPRLLASHYRLPEPAIHAPADDGSTGPNEPIAIAPPLRLPAEPLAGVPIAVIIPSRDPAAAARDMVASVLRHARRPDRVRCVLVDNGSGRDQPPAGGGLLTVPFNEPFNWSRANNFGARATLDAPLLVFANDDMEMLSSGWDEAVERRLAMPGVGAMGAALLYPDGRFQHAGIVLGVGERALAVHEGLEQDGTAKGPGGRWALPRAAAAVTGAFLATPRSVFDALSGFEEKLAVAYNDVDYAFRVRAAGLRVVYDPAVRLVHHESRSRGRNITQGQVAWDEAELAVLARRWGSALRLDPGYNPHWARYGEPFDGYREPAMSEVLHHLDLHSGGDPWRVEPVDQRGPDSA